MPDFPHRPLIFADSGRMRVSGGVAETRFALLLSAGGNARSRGGQGADCHPFPRGLCFLPCPSGTGILDRALPAPPALVLDAGAGLSEPARPRFLDAEEHGR